MRVGESSRLSRSPTDSTPLASFAAESLDPLTYIGYCTCMRRNITISLDQRFIELMDARRGSIPRSRWLEAQADPEHSAPIIEPVSRESIASEAVGPDDAFEPPALNKYGDPLDTVYDETDPRSWT